jgi:hypothetical protein
VLRLDSKQGKTQPDKLALPTCDKCYLSLFNDLYKSVLLDKKLVICVRECSVVLDTNKTNGWPYNLFTLY